MTMIKVNGLTKQFDQQTVVDGITFSVEKGEVLGFLGPNGAGKSTTMKMITGFLNPSSGSAEVCGVPVDHNSIEIKKAIGYLPEGAPAYGDMTPLSFLGFIADIRGFSGEEKQQRIESAIKRTHLESVLHKPIENLSKGFKRRVGLAQAILHDPAVLIMDEPTDGLDPNQKHEVRQLIQEMSRDKAIIVSTHILEEVHAICTRAVIIAQGKLLFDGTPDELEARSRYHQSVVACFNESLPAELESSLSALTSVDDIEVDGLRVTALATDASTLLDDVRELFKNKGWQPSELFVQRGHLDEVFRTITTGSGLARQEVLS